MQDFDHLPTIDDIAVLSNDTVYHCSDRYSPRTKRLEILCELASVCELEYPYPASAAVSDSSD